MPRRRPALGGLASVLVAIALTFVTLVQAGPDAKTDVLRKAVQALPAAKVAAALEAVSEALDVKAVLTNGTAHTKVVGGKKGKAAADLALPHPLVKLLAHVADEEEWKADELRDLAKVFEDVAEDGSGPPPDPVAPVAGPGTVEFVGETTADVLADAAAAAKTAAQGPVPMVRPPLPTHPPGTYVVWDEATQHWKIVPLAAVEKAERGKAAVPADADAAAADGAEEEEGREADEGVRTLKLRRGGPLAPGSLSPDQAERVAALEGKGLSNTAALAAVAATPGASAKVAYLWYLLHTGAADQPLDTNPLLVAPAPPVVFVDQTPTEDQSADAADGRRGRRLAEADASAATKHASAATKHASAATIRAGRINGRRLAEADASAATKHASAATKHASAATIRAGRINGRRLADASATTIRGRRLQQTTAPKVWGGNIASASVGGRYTPPDGGLAVGGGYIVQATNSFFSVRNATTGALIVAPTALATLMRTTNTQYGDPRVLFDATTGRFFVACYGLRGRNSFTYLATSKATNPRTGWYIYKVSNSVSSWPGCGGSTPCFGDYPMLGQNADSIWITVNLFSIRNNGYMYAGVGMWALGKTKLIAGANNVNVFSWNMNPSLFTLQPAKNAEPGKMHLLAATYTTSLNYVLATGTAGLNARTPIAPTLAPTQAVPSSLNMPVPPYRITQGIGSQLWGGDGRMQMCTQAGATPAPGARLYCTLDIACQMPEETTCLFIAALAPNGTGLTMESRTAIGATGRHTLLGAVAVNPATNVAGVAAIGVGTTSSSPIKVASLFFRYNGTDGAVTSSFAVSGSNWLFDSAVNPGRLGDYNDADLDAGGAFYGAAEYGYVPSQSRNWGTNIMVAGLA